jgi:hypothetical protein
MNELTLTVIYFELMLLTDFIESGQTKFYIGYVFCLTIVLLLAVNFVLMFVTSEKERQR